MKDNDNSLSIVWFLTGAALGASIALLYAPKSGRDTRRLIGRKAREHSDMLVDASRDLADKGRDLYKKGKGLADDAADLFERGRKLVEG